MAGCTYEISLWEQGFRYIAGCDEAGRGPLAGPLVVAAVILPANYINNKFDDSKKLSEKKREELFEEIIKVAISYKIIILDEKMVDQLNVYQASKYAMIQAIQQLSICPDFVLTDAMKLGSVSYPFLDIIKGDQLSQTIAAASILAKVTRDQMMIKYDEVYPQYGFAQHKGYGTKKHLEALKTNGICPIHRLTFEPVKKCINNKVKI